MGRPLKKTAIQQTKFIVGNMQKRIRKHMRNDSAWMPSSNMVNSLVNFHKTIAVLEGAIGEKEIDLNLAEIMKFAKKPIKPTTPIL